jgi:hypothetical protein
MDLTYLIFVAVLIVVVALLWRSKSTTENPPTPNPPDVCKRDLSEDANNTRNRSRVPATKEELAESARRAAGKRAEAEVREEMDKWMLAKPDTGWLLHNKLYEFNLGKQSEYSSEVDHFFVGNFNVFVIETKFKSGQISAPSSGPEWEVLNGGQKSTMRNALTQVKNTVKVIREELDIHAELVPIVVICGDHVTLRDNPSNVVKLSDLMKTIDIFECHASSEGKSKIQSLEIARILEQKSSSDVEVRILVTVTDRSGDRDRFASV